MDDDVNGIAATEPGARGTQPIVGDAQSVADQRRLAAWESEGGRLPPDRSKHP